MSLIQGNSHKSSVSGFYPKTIEGSLRFNDDDGAYLSWTPTSQGNLKTWTFSAWVKRAQSTGNYQRIFACGDSTDNYSLVYHDTGNYLTSQIRISGTNYTVSTAALYRDHSAWYHIVVEVDCTNAIHKLYVNGQQITEFQSTPTNPPNSNTNVGNTVAHYLGKNSESNQHYFEGYMAEVFFIDGTAHNADAFGETKNGVWVPKSITSADFDFDNNNSFHLTFQDDAEVEAFNTVLYRGNSGTQSITGMGFQPDLVWIKNRTGTNDHQLVDAVRGNTKALRSNDVNNEDTFTNGILSFDSDGVTLGSNSRYNATGNNYVAWGWKAGGAPTVDNSAGAGNVPTAGSVKIDGVDSTSALAGTIPATRISASTTYGFSIVDLTDPNTGASYEVGHGLDSPPEMFFIKKTNTTSDWSVYHKDVGNDRRLVLNDTGAQSGSSSVYFGSTTPTSSVVTIGSGLSTGDDWIMYCFHSVEGYSKFGSYSGGTANYKVTTGFKPSLVLIKRTDTGSTADWQMFDGTRDVSNPVTARLNPNQPYTELTNGNFDILSDGFELNDTSAGWNISGGTYIYAAFADTREAAFWLDQSGNDNDWQPVNLDHNDTVADSPTNNFCTMSPIAVRDNGTKATLSDGNLNVDLGAPITSVAHAYGTMAIPSSGQFFFEATFSDVSGGPRIGISVQRTTGNQSRYVYRSNGAKIVNTSESSYGDSFAAGDTIGVAVDVDGSTIEFFKNGTSQGPFSIDLSLSTGGSSNDYFPFVTNGSGASKSVVDFNFGQQPFKYDPPA